MANVPVEPKTHSDLDDLKDEMGHNTFNGVIRELMAFWKARNEGQDESETRVRHGGENAR